MVQLCLSSEMAKHVIPVVFVAILAVFSINAKAEELNKFLCNEELMQKIDHLVTNIPANVAEEIHNCIRKAESDLATDEVTAQCDTGVRKFPPTYYNIVEYPFLFAQCGSNVVDEMKDTLSPSEKERAASLEKQAMDIFDKISEIY